jgi:hypothetical protein
VVTIAAVASIAGAVTPFASAHTTDGSTCNNQVQPANPNGHVEALLANLSPAAGSKVSPGDTVSVLYTDEQPMASNGNGVTSPTLTIDGMTEATTVTATSGQTPTYIQPSDGGSEGTQCQDWITFKIPSNISSGNHTVTLTGYDSDNDHETVSWTYTTSKPTPPPPGIVSSQSLTPNDEGFVANGEGATGTMTFKLYPPGQSRCTGTPAFTQKVTVTDGVAETSNSKYIATQPGRWRWVITYSGDSSHKRATSPCGSEFFVLKNS